MKRKHQKNTDNDNGLKPIPGDPDINDDCYGLYPADKIPSGKGWTDELEERLKYCTRYPISRDAVESCDVTQLIYDLRPTLDNPLFASGPGKVIFEVEGYDINPRHLALVPAFRVFIRKVAESLPCWFYFAWPLSEWPNLITLAYATQLTIRDVDRKTLQFGIDRDELGEILRFQVGALETHCAAMGIPEEAVINHLDQLFARWFPDYLVGDGAD